MFSIKDGRGAFYQWDTGREITCPEGVDQIHFGNTAYGRALDVDVVDGTARVPDVLLQSDKPLHVWAWVGDPENGYTKESEVFRVERRNKPADYVYTPEEQQNLRDAVNEAVSAKEEAEAAQKAAQRYLEATDQKYQNTADVAAIAVQAREAAVKAAADSEAFSLNAQAAAADSEKSKAEAKKALEETKENAKGYVKTVNGQAPDANGNVQIQTGGGGGSDPNAVKYTPQSLTEAQKAQARQNIGAVSKEEVLAEIPANSNADWNAAEGEPGHVLNRTHWEESSLVEVLPDYTFMSYTGNGTYLETPLGITPGKTYIVIWEGVEYKCVAFTLNVYGFTITILGDYSSVDNNTPASGEPFYINEMDAETATAMGTPNRRVYIRPIDKTSREFTISITEVKETIHKLPMKFLPNGIPYVEESGTAEIMEEHSPTYDENDGIFMSTAAPTLSVGESYIVKWNGVEYTCVGQDLSAEMAGAVGLGDLTMMQEMIPHLTGNGEPFALIVMPGMATVSFSLEGLTEVTLGIYQDGTTIHKLDNRCLDLDWLPIVKKVDTEVLAESTFTNSDNTPLTRAVLPIGTNVAVIYDGVRYESTVIETPVNDASWITFGNLAILSAENFPDTGEPFCFTNLFEAGPYAVNFADGGTHTVSVYVTESTVNKMPEEFLPDSALYIGKELTEAQKAQARENIGAVTLSEVLSNFVPLTQEEYDALVKAGTVDESKYYMIVG